MKAAKQAPVVTPDSKLKMKRIGFFGGSFDPIHLGHLNLALQILEQHNLDQIFFCPNSQSPHKTETPPVATKEHRRAMVVAAIAPIPKFTFLDVEIQKSSPSFTIDTIHSLYKTEAKGKKQIYLILGEDALANFHQWKEVEELVALAPPLVGSRSDAALPKSLSKPLLAALQKGMTKTPIMEVSSTEIRRRLQLGLYCGHLLPAKVWDYINTNQLYHQSS
jgi:nicotinate-nucleotide adenylyltransferase